MNPQTQHPPSAARKPKLLASSAQRGFTMVEIMIAIMIIGLGLASSAICLRIGMIQNDMARSTTYVTQVLQDEAEQIRLLNWSALQNLTTTATFTASDSITFPSIDPDKFTFTREINNIIGESGLKQIRLTARWSGIKNDAHELSMVFNYAENGMHDYYYGIRP
ncbi:prepilin-type N-terminal cleavage/methylation domain-containing protein [Coraliomargarita algicola]|uniref:Prepilin-type N-terminal cleavage/methylation domain-containing protein n=1 Tax=Coraliomargarita algicola TaxID=3092156 RepID=A0ABZ0RFS4_9BACT|nr:prepilin-type N-terminal cleavage/methylation domain-containing protein [Coraliomargarita sp. J2-16]WPJ93938.1 prepilin-type N-terminal cleavage/methylation domain-containing protein [Coraliomargarita sp. J2-16]